MMQTQSYWLTEWCHFFPGDASRYDDLLQNLVDYFRACEQEHKYDRYDVVLTQLEAKYTEVIEPTRFLALLTHVVPLLEQEIRNPSRGLAAFESFGTGVLFGDENGEFTIPANGYPINNLLRVQDSLTRVKQWLRVQLLTPAEQLLDYLKTIPVVRWRAYPEGDRGAGLRVTLSIPMDAVRGANKTVLERLWPATQKELRSISDGQRQALAKQLLHELRPIAVTDLADVRALANRSLQNLSSHDAHRLPEYFLGWKWGDLSQGGSDQIDAHFWRFLKIAMDIRQAWAQNFRQQITEIYLGPATVAATQPEPTAGTVAPKDTSSLTNSLTHRQLVLLCLYRGQSITNLNCERVAKELKSNAPSAAAVLLRRWKEWGSVQAVQNAKGKRTVSHLVRDMEWVITQLNDEQKKVADNDLRYIMREIN